MKRNKGDPKIPPVPSVGLRSDVFGLSDRSTRIDTVKVVNTEDAVVLVRSSGETALVGNRTTDGGRDEWV